MNHPRGLRTAVFSRGLSNERRMCTAPITKAYLDFYWSHAINHPAEFIHLKRQPIRKVHLFFEIFLLLKIFYANFGCSSDWLFWRIGCQIVTPNKYIFLFPYLPQETLTDISKKRCYRSNEAKHSSKGFLSLNKRIRQKKIQEQARKFRFY